MPFVEVWQMLSFWNFCKTHEKAYFKASDKYVSIRYEHHCSTVNNSSPFPLHVFCPLPFGRKATMTTFSWYEFVEDTFNGTHPTIP